MEKRSKLKYLISGFVLGSIMFSGLTYATTNSIQVNFDPVRFIINGIDKTPSDGKFNNNGTVVEASFIYNGTTYIPMRMVSNMLGKSVDWDGKTRSVIIGNALGDGSRLTSLTPTKTVGTVALNRLVKIQGQSYEAGILLYNDATLIGSGPQERISASYNLDAKYAKLSLLLGLNEWDDTQIPLGYDVKIYNDDNGAVLWQGSLLGGTAAQEVSTDVSGVLKLSIVAIPKSKTYGYYGSVAVINPYLTLK